MGCVAELTDSDVVEMAKRAADKFWLDALACARKASEALPFKPCRKCGGSGNIQHMTHVEWGKCFGCNGIGRVIIRCAAMDKIGRDLARANVERLRMLYRGYSLALSMVMGGMTDCATWELDAEIDGYRSSLERLKTEGQDAARRA